MRMTEKCSIRTAIEKIEMFYLRKGMTIKIKNSTHSRKREEEAFSASSHRMIFVLRKWRGGIFKKNKIKMFKGKDKGNLFYYTGISAAEITAVGCPCGQNIQERFVTYVDKNM